MADLAHQLRRLLVHPTLEPDGDLLGRFVNDGDGAAFAELVRRHGPMVLAVCRRVLRHQEDAEDAFQATFLVLARQASSVRSRSTLGNWLYGVAYRTAVGARRIAAARRAREAKLGAMRGSETWPDDGLAASEFREALDRELSALPDAYRAALVACDLEGLSRQEAAAQLQWSEGTLSSRLARARSLLARRLARFKLVIPAAGLLGTGPEVAASLVTSTVRLGTLIAAGETAVVGPVAAIMEGTMKAMLLTKLKTLASASVLGCAVLVTVVAGWHADAAGPEDPPSERPKAAEAPRKVRNADKDRIAELERERDQLRKEVAELRDRLALAEADQKLARESEQKRATELERRAKADAEIRRAFEREVAPASPAPTVAPPEVTTSQPKPSTAPANPRSNDVAGTEPKQSSRLHPTVPANPVTNDTGVLPLPPPLGSAVPLNKPAPGSNGAPPSPASPSDPFSRRPEMPVPVNPAVPGEPSQPAAKVVGRVYQVAELAGDEKEGEALAKVVRSTVDPKSWGTDAGVEFLPGRKILVVRQTIPGHAEVAELLHLLQKSEAPSGPKAGPKP